MCPSAKAAKDRQSDAISNLIRLQVVKDLFVFSCYTGLAYIGVFNLTPANLIEKSANNIWIATNRQKTNEPVRVPLLPKALAFIEKYKGHPQALAEGKVLPVLTNQKLNSYLKEIADISYCLSCNVIVILLPPN